MCLQILYHPTAQGHREAEYDWNDTDVHIISVSGLFGLTPHDKNKKGLKCILEKYQNSIPLQEHEHGDMYRYMLSIVKWNMEYITNELTSVEINNATRSNYIVRARETHGFKPKHTLQWRQNEHDGLSNPYISIICSIVCSYADQGKHQSSASLAFKRGMHRWPVNSPHKGPVTQKCFHSMPYHEISCFLVMGKIQQNTT